MAHLIDKSAIVSELERKHNNEVQWMARQGYTDYNMGLRDGYADILSYIESLEVKEVDLKKELDEYFDTHDNEFLYDDYLELAKHFYELCLKVVQKGE